MTKVILLERDRTGGESGLAISHRRLLRRAKRSPILQVFAILVLGAVIGLIVPKLL